MHNESMNLETETRKLLEDDARSPLAIAKKMPAKPPKIGWRWLYRFKNDEVVDYGIRRVQKLYNFLK